ncbi:hypothetical protein [Leptolyngbya sp. KIOST-1]|uniref:hypothetical protein n=1 Tax=Leptolyngbya sp. KIOST-1 TaxID=1229172 RepID=UPI000566EFC4|nr:hypothetical protein [Leptolyngbya sp. KIOST-1]
MNRPLRPLLLAALATLTAGAGLAQNNDLPSKAIHVPTAVESPTGQLRCRAVITAGAGESAVMTELEFVYPQLRTAEYLQVQLAPLTTDADPNGLELDSLEPGVQKAWFSTPGEDSYWTVPVVFGVSPVVITLVAAPRQPVNDRFVASFCGSPAVPVVCEPL